MSGFRICYWQDRLANYSFLIASSRVSRVGVDKGHSSFHLPDEHDWGRWPYAPRSPRFRRRHLLSRHQSRQRADWGTPQGRTGV